MRTLSVAILAALLSLPATAQTEQPSPGSSWKDKLYVGGGVGASFGDIDYVEVAPLVGYQVHPRVSVGVGLLYRWTEDNRYAVHENTSDYGGNLFTRITLVPKVFAELQYEYLNYEYALSAGGTLRTSSSDFLAGAGFLQPAGKHGGVYFSALYNLSYDANDPITAYDGPWVYRVGVTFGF